jgi:hypothetical protein
VPIEYSSGSSNRIESCLQTSSSSSSTIMFQTRIKYCLNMDGH